MKLGKFKITSIALGHLLRLPDEIIIDDIKKDFTKNVFDVKLIQTGTLTKNLTLPNCSEGSIIRDVEIIYETINNKIDDFKIKEITF